MITKTATFTWPNGRTSLATITSPSPDGEAAIQWKNPPPAALPTCAPAGFDTCMEVIAREGLGRVALTYHGAYDFMAW